MHFQHCLTKKLNCSSFHSLQQLVRLSSTQRLESFFIQVSLEHYDPSAVPRVETSEHQRFFPVEGVCGIGEVKSNLSKVGLKDALNKLARVKSKADAVSSTIPIHRDRSVATENFSRETNLYDQIFSFLVCEKFDFDSTSLATEVGGWYEADIKSHHKHNLVLSLSDGLLLYVDSRGKSWMYPSTPNIPAKNRFVQPQDNLMLHFYLFFSYMNILASSTTILFPEMKEYMPSIAGGFNHDER